MIDCYASVLNIFKKPPLPVTAGVQLASDNVSLFLLDQKNKAEKKVSGYLSVDIDKQQPSEAVKVKLQNYVQENGVKGAHTCLVLDDKDYQLLVVEAPNVAEDEMSEAVKWKIKDLVPHELSDIIVDVFLQEDGFSSNKKMANAVVVVKELIAAKTAFVESLGLRLKAIDIPELAYRNYLEHHGRNEESIAMVTLKKESGKLSVIHNNQVCFTVPFLLTMEVGF